LCRNSGGNNPNRFQILYLLPGFLIANDFQHKGKCYGGRGVRTKAEARAARERRRKEVKSIKPISKLLRHKNTRTTEIYLHSIDDATREAMRSLEGQFLAKTTTQSHYQNEDEKIKNDITY
jgi:hypothetical protein